RRYTVQEKILALSLIKRSPACYSLLEKICNMPSKKTLQRLLQKITIRPGICNIIITYLRKKVNTLNNKDRYCVLMWDEMALMPHIQYDSKYDVITGFEDWGMRRSNKFADHALVFMIRELYSG
ncbi:THAP domain-containing protein 9, partial [Harpegnathos saltator]